jgi:hypothetical protein
VPLLGAGLSADLPRPLSSFTVGETMCVLLRRLVSVAVATGLGVTSPVVLAAPEPDADVSAETEPEEVTAKPEPVVIEPSPQPEPPGELEPAPGELDTDEDAPGELDTDEPAPGELDTDEDAPVPETDLDDETLDRDADDSFVDDYQSLRDSPEAKTARRWLTAGIAATTTGAVLVGGAIAMSQTNPCDFKAGNNCFEDSRDKAAVTLGAPGGLLLLGGIAMTIVGALQRRALWHDLAFVPAPNGLVVTGRF